MAKRKKDGDFSFIWERPDEREDRVPDKSFGFSFTIPRFAIPSIHERVIPISIGETDREIIVRAELPGFDKNEISLNVTKNFIEIIAAKKEEHVERTEKSFRHEKSSQAVRRSFSLPASIDHENVDATLEGGVLTVSMPKTGKSEKKKKKLEIE